MKDGKDSVRNGQGCWKSTQYHFCTLVACCPAKNHIGPNHGIVRGDWTLQGSSLMLSLDDQHGLLVPGLTFELIERYRQTIGCNSAARTRISLRFSGSLGFY